MPSEINPGEKYRLHTQTEAREREGVNVATTTPWLAPQVDFSVTGQGASGNQRHSSKFEVSVWWLVLTWLSVMTFVALFVLTSMQSSWHSTGTVSLIALAPLFIVTVILGTVDKWAPLGWGYKLTGFLWGAGVAAGLAILVNSGAQMDLLRYRGDPSWAEVTAAVKIAPVSEEVFKGIGVILILVIARHRLTSTLSAFAFAGLVGAGFAYVENIQYFVEAAGQGSGMLTRVVFARGVLSPFVHPMATSFTGWAVGSALLRRSGVLGWLWRLPLGLGTAIMIHSGWNAMASFGGEWWILLYLCVGIPAFVLWLLLLLVWSRRVVKMVRSGLRPYVESGWVSWPEAAMATEKPAAKYAKKWAKRIGSPAPRLMRRFIEALRHLGLDQELMARNGADDKRLAVDRQLLLSLGTTRGEFARLEALRGEETP